MTTRKNIKKCPKCGTSLGSFWGDLVCEHCGWYSKGHHLMLKYVMPLCGIFFLVLTLFAVLAEIGFNPFGFAETDKFPVGPIIGLLSFGIFPLLFSLFFLKGIRVRRERGLARSAGDNKGEISEAMAQTSGTLERQIAETSAVKHQADMVVGANNLSENFGAQQAAPLQKPNLRKNTKAIFELLAQSKYVDGEETRTYLIMEKMDLAEAMAAFPDCDVAYLRAAYPTMNAEDHKNASVALLLEGLEKSARKSRILSRLSKYYVWCGEVEKALGYAVQTLLALQTRPLDDEYLQPIVLLKELFSFKGYEEEVARLEAIRPRYTLGGTEQSDTMKAVRTLGLPQYSEIVEEARHSLLTLSYEIGPKTPEMTSESGELHASTFTISTPLLSEPRLGAEIPNTRVEKSSDGKFYIDGIQIIEMSLCGNSFPENMYTALKCANNKIYYVNTIMWQTFGAGKEY